VTRRADTGHRAAPRALAGATGRSFMGSFGSQRAMRATLAALAMLGCLAAAPRCAHARDVRIPITIDYVTLTEALKYELYTAPGGRAPLWNGSDECQFLYALNPRFSRSAARVRLETDAALGLGVSVAGRCLSPIEWQGIIEAESAPYIAPGLKLKFSVLDINLYNAQHEKTLLAGRGFDLVKEYFIPRLETFSYDLNPAVARLGALAEDASAPVVADRIKRSLATVRAEPEVTPLNDGVHLTLVISVPDFPAPAVSPTPAEPTAADIESFDKLLDQWDAFLVFALKQLGETVGDREFRDELLQILVESRYRLVQALAHPPAASEPDPVRSLFLEIWQRLGASVRSAAGRGKLGARSLEFLSFISAGDALFALDQAAPALGMRISAADLRRLAHIMAPSAKGDPLEYNFNEDAELKRLFKPTEPLANPSALEGTPGESSGPSAAPAAAMSPRAEPSPASAPSPARTPPSPAPTSLLPLGFLQPADAAASETDSLGPRLEGVAARLWRALASQDNVESYRADMSRLLDLSAERESDQSQLDDRYRAMFRVLAESAAWQESCWRQFIRANGRIRWLESSTGDIGLMQVNKHVWRGFYSLERLRWDVLYNAGAGCEILMQMTEYVIARRLADPVPVMGNLARSAYAAYNGGPWAYNRWRAQKAEPGRTIDAAYWEKYRAVERGDAIDILACAEHRGRVATR